MRRRLLVAVLLVMLVVSSFIAGVSATQADPTLNEKIELLKTVADYGLKGLREYLDFLLDLFQIALSH